MKPKTLVLIGGILLMVGAAAPWATVTSSFLGLSRSFIGLEGAGIFTAGGGLILFLIGLLTKSQPGRSFSVWGAVVSIACAVLLSWKINDVAATRTAASTALSFGFGLSCLSPLGALLGLLGSVMRTPAMQPIPQTPVDPSAPTAGSTS